MQQTIFVAALLGLAGGVFAQQPGASPKARCLIGLDNIKRNASGTLAVQDDALQFTAGGVKSQIPLKSVDDIFVGTETTQGGGAAGTVAKTAAIAAPFHTGSALTLLLRTRVDLLTVVYRDTNGGLHGAIFSVGKGQAPAFRTRLVAAGAHASAPQEELTAKDPKERSNP